MLEVYRYERNQSNRKKRTRPFDIKHIFIEGNRVSEIMKHGFPSLDNIRTYDDYVLAYDKRNRTAQWVFEHLTPRQMHRADGIDRDKSRFQEDPSVHQYFRQVRMSVSLSTVRNRVKLYNWGGGYLKLLAGLNIYI